MTLGKAPSQSDMFSSGADLCEERLGESSIYRLLHRECHRLFPDELFADLFTHVGRRSVPPRIVAVVMVLQRLEGLSDRDAVDRFAFDLRWKYAAGGLEFDFPGFVHTVLVDFVNDTLAPIYGVDGISDRGHIFKDGQGVTLEQDPYAAFDRLFQGGALSSAVLAQQHASRTSVLDYVHKQLEGYGKILGTADRQRIAFHLDSIRQLEKRLASGGTTMAAGGKPDSLTEPRFDPKDVSSFHLATRAMLDLIVVALASGSTRAATLLLSDGDAAGLAMPWLGPDYALDTGSYSGR